MHRDVIVVGASAGGVQALVQLVSALPPSLPASVFIVLHVAPSGFSALPAILGRATSWPVTHAVDGEDIRPGHIYVAPPRAHLLLERHRMRLGDGPPENGHRPAIDALFRSAAHAHRGRVVGIILSGTLDDGTAGLWAVKRRGGVAIVQDPAEAQHPGMIRSAMETVPIDHVLPVASIADRLALLTREDFPDPSLPRDALMEHEVTLAAHAHQGSSLDDPYGADVHPSPMACPTCGGVLWEIGEERNTRYRCRVGHAFSSASLLTEQSTRLEEALWSACRALEENAAMARRLARRAAQSSHEAARQRFEERARQATERARLVRQVLESDARSVEPERDRDDPDEGTQTPLAPQGGGAENPWKPTRNRLTACSTTCSAAAGSTSAATRALV